MLLALARSANAAQYYVATNGSDNNPGTAVLPWRTLQFAADEVAAGDLVTVRPGNYAGFELTTDGDADNRIEFFAEPGVHITSGVPGRGDGINLEGASFITIDGFNIANMPHAGVRSVGFEDDFATDVIVRNVTASNNDMWGIFTGHVNNLLIERNFTSGSQQVEHGIYVSNSGDNPTIRNNTIWGNNGSGIHMNGDESAGGDGIISGAHVYGNVIYDNGLTGSERHLALSNRWRRAGDK
jgi:parallel beta-helix repeat protein